MIEFHRLTAGHFSAALDLMETFYAIDSYPFDREKAAVCIKEFSENEELGRFFLIYSDGILAGYVVLTFGYSFEYLGRDAFLDELFISPDFRGKGIGNKAITFLEEEAQKLAVNAIHLEVESSNPNAQKLYRNRGFSGNKRALLTKRISL